MSSFMKSRAPHVLMLAVALAAVLTTVILQSAHAQREGGPAGVPRFTVVMTEGHNLVVTDNGSNTLYFYTIDKDKEIGSELRLRGSVDLAQVGKPEIKPVTHKAAL